MTSSSSWQHLHLQQSWRWTRHNKTAINDLDYAGLGFRISWLGVGSFGISWFRVSSLGVSWCWVGSFGVGWCWVGSLGVSWCWVGSFGVSSFVGRFVLFGVFSFALVGDFRVVSVVVGGVGDDLSTAVGEGDTVRSLHDFAVAGFLTTLLVVGGVIVDVEGEVERSRGLMGSQSRNERKTVRLLPMGYSCWVLVMVGRWVILT